MKTLSLNELLPRTLVIVRCYDERTAEKVLMHILELVTTNRDVELRDLDECCAVGAIVPNASVEPLIEFLKKRLKRCGLAFAEHAAVAA